MIENNINFLKLFIPMNKKGQVFLIAAIFLNEWWAHPESNWGLTPNL